MHPSLVSTWLPSEETPHFQREGTRDFSPLLCAQNDLHEGLTALLPPQTLASSTAVGKERGGAYTGLQAGLIYPLVTVDATF